MAIIKSKDIVFLFGAGASSEAGIPTSADMISKIEKLLTQQERWKKYEKLYNHVKSSIHYVSGLRGHFNDQVNYNIETLVNTLHELERNEDHPLYPFIATWNSRFIALAEPDFSSVKSFRHLILKELKKWMCPDNASSSDYYEGLVRLQQNLNFPIPIFSLNYDLCVERLNTADFRVETGFAGFGPEYIWEWERFEDVHHGTPPQIMLYKLHGSINWKRDDSTKRLFSVEQVESVEHDEMEVIFGRDFKLEAADPYLFYVYEFRRYTLQAPLIVVVGYGFGDTYINKILVQALRADNPHHLLVICNCDENDKDNRLEKISGVLELEKNIKNKMEVHIGSAKQFLEREDLERFLADKLPQNPEIPF